MEDVKYLDAIYMGDEFWNIEDYEPSNLDFRVYFGQDGIPRYKINNISVLKYSENNATKKFHKKGLFVLDIENELHMAPRHSEIAHHSDFLSGIGVLCAGEYKLNNLGVITILTNKSGHYMPSYECLEYIEDMIRYEGYGGKIKYILYQVIGDEVIKKVTTSSLV